MKAKQWRYAVVGVGIVVWLIGAWVLLGLPMSLSGINGPGPMFEDYWIGYLTTPMLLVLQWLERPLGIFPNSAQYWIVSFLVLGGIVLIQCMLLLPGPRWLKRTTSKGRSIWISLFGGGIIAALISFGLLATIAELLTIWPTEYFDDGRYAWLFLGAMAFLWLFWAIIFGLLWRSQTHYTRVGRMAKWLVAGTTLEMLVAVPSHVLVGAQRDCYCVRGTYTGVVFGLMAAMCLFGPAVVLLLARDMVRRRQLLGKFCMTCGYDLRGTMSAGRPECPECGTQVPMRSAGT